MKGQLRAAPIFSDNMVLQHGKPVPVWGTGPENGAVRVCWICVEKQSAEASAKVQGGQWRLKLPPLAAGLSGELVISCETEELRFGNVITGDVWFAGGQSNMEMELVNVKNGVAELAACANKNIRWYQVVKRAVVDNDYLREEAESKWQVCAPDTSAMLSAAAFFFARKINADLNIPIGIINCSWGGTSISTWMSREQLVKSRAGQKFIDIYAEKVGDKTDEQYNAEMEQYFEYWRKWNDCIVAKREEDPNISWERLNIECGQCPWPQPAGNTSPYCPVNLHTARVRRTAPFAIKGFIYYQGEEDDLRAADYREMMYYLIEQWRKDWEDEKLPFLFVQLTMYVSQEEIASGNPPRHWCLMRESQYLASLDVANSGLAVIIDCGEFDNIHPFDKQTVGFRLALQALKKVYGKDIEADGPVFSWVEVQGGSLRVHFDNAQSGLEFRGEPAGFEIAAAEGKYFPAKAVVDGASVVITSDKVAEPERARYAWTKFGPTPLYAKNGLPAMPFRSNRNEPAEL
ncbi:MAG: sialate O-acetylesterase [Treponema sp.]|jgi:sialate O-acetylesterase|nr:sialate O-acetylesterase [Treponema sp.]